ncbi:MAG: SDR family oxidoreductase [Clostridia bacterium]|nr:SDR family oxidoreductase [Clostridia bacterium]
MLNYLITGGAGFIGSNLVEAILKAGHNVRVVDNLSTGKFENIREFINDIDFICGDLTDYRIAQKAVDSIDYVLHQAAIPSVPRSVADPIATNESIVTATVNLFRAAVETRNVKRIVQAASSSAYGNTPTLPKKEDMIPNPMSPYAVAKLTQEYYGKAFYNVYGLEVLSLRYFNVFGPKQDPNSFYAAVIPKFISLMMQDKQPTIYGDGETSRDFSYIENVVNANLKASVCKWPGNAEVFNIGCGQRISLNELVKNINSILGTDIKPNYENERVGDVKHSLADISKAEELIGFKPSVDVYEGLNKLIEWMKQKS